MYDLCMLYIYFKKVTQLVNSTNFLEAFIKITHDNNNTLPTILSTQQYIKRLKCRNYHNSIFHQ